MNKVKYVLIDGYNVINAWDNLKKLMDEKPEEARHELIEMLQDFAVFRDITIWVVFDAHYVLGGFEKHYTAGYVEVVYTKEGESADCYIERNVAELSKAENVAVVSSDYLEQRIVLQFGGIRITPREFLEEINYSKKHIKEKTKILYTDKINKLENNLDKSIRDKLEKMRRNL